MFQSCSSSQIAPEQSQMFLFMYFVRQNRGN
uniref:Uncharacterized protein n=1 Tax=Anguilla anguilla TaxID=7936 RepID=A0A0E9PT39_ANGAN